MKNLVLGVLLPIVLLASGIGAFVAMRRPDPPREPALGSDKASLLKVIPAAEVQQVLALTDKSETLDIAVSGTVVPFREIELAAEVGGKIIDKDPLVRSGNMVTKGQVLYRIDPRDYELEIEVLSRRRDQELAALEELDQNIANTQSLLEVAEEQYQLSDAEVKRFETLGNSFASMAELDNAKRTRLTSMNQRVTLQNQLKTFQTSKSRLELAARLAETQLKQAQLNLERTTIVAPVDGRIVSEEIERDSYVQRGTKLVVIEDTEKVEVACNLRMDQLYWVLDQSNVSADQLVNAALASRFELPNIPVTIQFEVSGRESIRYEWQGKLSRYDGAGMDPQSRTVPVRVLVENPSDYMINGKPASQHQLSGPPTLVRGMFVEAIVKAKPATRLLLVPKLSVKPATSTSQIWKFLPNEAAYETAADRFVKKDAEDGDSSTAEAESSTGTENAMDKEELEGSERTPKLDPADWIVGYLHVLDGVQVVGSYRDSTAANGPTESGRDENSKVVEYLICEVRTGDLTPGDLVVVTPLPGIDSGGDEVIRVPNLAQ